MKFIFSHSVRSLYFFAICLMLAMISSQSIYAQSVKKAQRDFAKLNDSYLSGGLSDDQYFDRADSLKDQYLSDGIYFNNQEFTDLLSLYKKIAWGKNEYDIARKNYYIAFLNNFSMFEKNGTSIYYAEKAAKQYKKNGERDPLIEASTKSQIYMEQHLYKRVISLYTEQKPYINTLPKLIRNGDVDVPTGIEALTLLSAGVIEAYIKTNDTTAIYETEKLITDIAKEINSKDCSEAFFLFNDFFMVVTDYYVALFEQNHIKLNQVLNKLENLKSIYKNQSTGFIDQNLIPWRIDHYLTVKNTDSAAVYIKKYENYPIFGKDQKAKIYEFKAKFETLKGNFQQSNNYLILALEEERKVQSKLMTEMDELLYAFTEAENTRIDLQNSEQVKEERTVWLIIISTAAGLIILSIYFLMLYRSRKAKAQIEELNNTADMQIIAMEETKHQAVREEQQRLGQDLHDGLSSSIAAVRYQLETLIIDTQDGELKNKLSKLQNETIRAYEAARNKSHEWFSVGEEAQQLSFEKQIRLLTGKALPENRYTKVIHVDNDSLINVPTDTRIALLRIIQESITNIIKHAKAKKVEILLYEEDNSLILSIGDDGSGFDSKSNNKKSMLGIQSIKRRVQYLNGNEEIQSDKNGTRIKVFIPLAQS